MDITKASGVAEVDALVENFKRTSDTNALLRLCALVGDPGRKPSCAGALGALAPYLSPSQIKDDVIPALITGLNNKKPGVRRDCAMVLDEYFSSNAVPAIPALIKVLRGNPDDTLNASIYAAEALGKIGPAAARALPELIATLREPERQALGYEDLSVRVKAAQALGKIGVHDKDAQVQLQKALGDANQYVRAASAQAILQIGGNADRAVATLIELLHSNEAAVRRFVLRAMQELRPLPESLAASLRTRIDAEHPDVQNVLREILRPSDAP